MECRLCGRPVGRFGVKENKGEPVLSFCCFGCRQVFQILSRLPEGSPSGFKDSDLYRICRTAGLISREEEDRGPALRQEAGSAGGVPVASEEALAQELILRVEGLWCSACAWLIEELVGRLEGVLEVKALCATDLVRVTYLPQQVAPADIRERISRLGFPAASFQDLTNASRERKREQLRLGLSAILTAHVMMISLILYAGFFKDLGTEAIGYLSYPLGILATPVLLYGGFPIFKKALAGLRYGKPSMEVLMAIGALSAYFYSLIQLSRGGLHLYFDTAAMLIVLVLLGKYLEVRAREKISRGVLELYQLANQKVRLLTEKGEEWRGAGKVLAGETFQVLAGERVPVDGLILSGRAYLDESYLTGESHPIKRGPRDEVRAGSLLLDNPLQIRATRGGAESSLGQIIALMQEGLARKTAMELLSDRLTRWVVPAILFLAAATALVLVQRGVSWEESLLRAITILVISCPCALGIAAPLAKVAAITAGRTKGILIRDPAALKKMSKLDVLIFDKTGTLTEGRYGLREVFCLETSREEALGRIAAVEAPSDHFLAREIQNQAREWSLAPEEVQDFQALTGLGVCGVVAGLEVIVGNRRLMRLRGLKFPRALEPRAGALEGGGMTLVFFGWEGQVQGFMAFGDALKERAREAVADLRAQGLQIGLISGDSPETTGAIARELAVGSFFGQVPARDKVRIIQDLQQQGHRVGMIGDGLNDAAALAQADVGLALGTRVGILTEAADITLVAGDPLKIREVLALAGRTTTIIRQNLLFAFLYNILAIPLAVTGRLNPLIAVLAMFASSLTVVGNTMRIFREGHREPGRNI
ncbi:MAG: cation-translocating P-type ATPase [Deltaproteobacteria bacterium]|nr:cation-translocating P-type ATPase [Deltaproteobacteria bacterium]